MKVVLASVTFIGAYTSSVRFLALGYLHAHAITDDLIGPRTEIIHEYYDSSTMSPEAIAQAIAEEKPDLVAFSCYVWNTPDICKAGKILKDMLPEVQIILGGPEVSYHHHKLMEQHPYLDCICVGEGEETFRELLRAKVGGRPQDIAGIAGLCQRKDGKPYIPAVRVYEKDLDRFASPYLTGVLDVCDVRGGVSYQTVRGCPFVCTYCDYGRNQPYFEFSMDRVRAEFEFFKATGAKVLFNLDPTFNYNRARAEGLLDLALELDMKAMQWFEVFPTLVNQDLIDLIDKTYLSFVGCGIQTCTPTTMRNIRRVWRPEKIAPILDLLKYKKNVIWSYEIIMGLPGDGLEEYKDTLSWTYEREAADIKASNLAILPQTPLEGEIQAKKWNIDYDQEIGHEILSTDHMGKWDVLVAKAINNWHRMLQNLFIRLRKIVPRPAGQLIEDWADHVYHSGQHDQVNNLIVHDFPSEIVETIADLWQEFVAKVLENVGAPDVSAQFKDLLRYHFYRRARTWPGAFFANVRDIYFNEPYPELHRYFEVLTSELPPSNGTTGAEIPELGGDMNLQMFRYDMHELYPHLNAEEMSEIMPKETAYVFFMEPETGAGCGIIVDDCSRRFLELVDGKTSVAAIAHQLKAVLSAEAETLAPRIYTAFKEANIFQRPKFLADHDGGKLTWESSFPETFRHHH